MSRAGSSPAGHPAVAHRGRTYEEWARDDLRRLEVATARLHYFGTPEERRIARRKVAEARATLRVFERREED